MLKPTVVALVVLGSASAATFAKPQAAQQPALATQNTGPTSPTRMFQRDATRDDATGLVKPVALQTPQPTYTTEALRARVQGSVGVQIVVGADGSVARARVVEVAWSGEGGEDQPPSFTETTPGLVVNALSTVKNWKFKPGTLDGAPVPVLTTVKLTFRIH